jgi:hypothetical protein
MLAKMSQSSPPPGKAAAERRSGPFNGIQGLMLTITLVACLAVLTLPILRPDGGRRQPLRIVVAEPELRGGEAAPKGRELLLEALRDSLERQLSGRSGLYAARLLVPPAEAAATAGELGAEEVLSTRVASSEGGLRIGLSRRRTIDGQLVWQRDQIHLAEGDLRRIDRQLADALELAYVRYPRPLEAVRLFAEPADYEAYLQLRIEGRETADPALLAPRFAALRAGSPRFFEAYLWPARALAAPPRRPGAAEEALALLGQAGRIAPQDPRPAEAAFHLLLELGRREEAGQRLAELERLRPGDPDLNSWRSLLDQGSVASPGPESGDGKPEP